VFARYFVWFICVFGLASYCLKAETNQIYIVKKGDTLTHIARFHHVSLDALIKANQINPRAVLSIGQQLIIPKLTTVTTNQSISTNPSPVLVMPPPDLRKSESNIVALVSNDHSLAITNISSPPTNFVMLTNTTVVSENKSSLPKESREVIYVIKPGDNLYNIGKRFGVTVKQLTEWNQISAKFILKIGQRLKIYPSQPKVITNSEPVLSTPPNVEPLVLDPPKPIKEPEKPAAASTTAIKSNPQPSVISTQSVTVAKPSVEEKKPDEKIEKVEKIETAEKPKPEPKPTPAPVKKPVTQPKPPPAALPPSTPKPTSSSKTDSYIFLQRVKAKLDQPKVKAGRWKYIVIHHSGTKQGSAKIFETYHRKVKRMENGLAYHFVIGNGTSTRDGEIEIGNRWMKQLQGGHLYSEYLNSIAIGICFVGDFSRQKPTAKQIAACIELVEYLKKRCGNSKIKFCLHREINPRPTSCPGDRFPSTLLHRRLD
jgi:LysM repeat protein